MTSADKKTKQLGMNISTAASRLRIDVLFKLTVEAGHSCFHCKEELTRDNFSIEHIEPWLDSHNPYEQFFDLSNIAFSHKSCNASAARKPTRKYYTKEEQLTAARICDAKRSKKRVKANKMRRKRLRDAGLPYT